MTAAQIRQHAEQKRPSKGAHKDDDDWHSYAVTHGYFATVYGITAAMFWWAWKNDNKGNGKGDGDGGGLEHVIARRDERLGEWQTGGAKGGPSREKRRVAGARVVDWRICTWYGGEALMFSDGYGWRQ